MIPHLLVFLQFSVIFLFLLSGAILPLHFPEILVTGLGVFIGIWAIVEQKPGNFNITPTNKNGAQLIQSGPYKYVRHPMYLSIIIALAPLVIMHFNWIRMATALILVTVLVLKLEYEERQLIRHFQQFVHYKSKTWKLIPFVY